MYVCIYICIILYVYVCVYIYIYIHGLILLNYIIWLCPSLLVPSTYLMET